MALQRLINKRKGGRLLSKSFSLENCLEDTVGEVKTPSRQAAKRWRFFPSLQ